MFAGDLDVPLKKVQFGKHPVTNLVGRVSEAEEYLDEDEQDTVLKAVVDNAKSIAASHPTKLSKLRGDIELVALDYFIDRFEQNAQTETSRTRMAKVL